MELVKLEEKEFTDFAYNHEQATFLQTICWAKLKETNGWEYELVGYKENNKIIAGMILLSKKTPLGKMFYAPRGFIIDYYNFDLLKEFTNAVKKYVKKNKGIYIKIDPYVMLIERDSDGNIVPGGVDNTSLVKSLNKLGFKEVCGKTGQQGLQAKWMYRLETKNKTIDDILGNMDRKKRWIINNNIKSGLVVREGTYDELGTFMKIMDHTSERKKFINRSLSYYQNMYQCFGNGDILKLYFTELRIEDTLNSFKNELTRLETDYNKLMEDIDSGVRKVNSNTLDTKKQEITKLKDKIVKYEELYNKHGSVLILGGMLYFIFGREVLSFMGGAYSEYSEFQSSYTINYEMIKYAIDNGYDYYNFYGISSDLSEKDPMYGVYQFKKNFNGEVVELLGEYDLKVNKFAYFVYKFSYFVVHKLKRVKFIFKK